MPPGSADDRAASRMGREPAQRASAGIYPVVGMATDNERSYGLPLALEVMRWLGQSAGDISNAGHANQLRAKQLQRRPDE